MGRVWRWTLVWTALSAGGVVQAQEVASESDSASDSDTASESDTASDSEPAELAPPPAAPTSAPPPPTSGYTAPQGYAPQQPWERPRSAVQPRRRRVSIPYREGMTVPPGGSLVSRRRKGLLIPGLLGFTATYLMNIVGSAMDEDNGIIAIPFVGLPIQQIREGDDSERPLVAVHTVVQLAAFAMLVVGLIPRRTVEYFTLAGRSKDDGLRWALVPSAHRRGAGLALTLF